MNNQLQLIAKLKQQPKQGRGVPTAFDLLKQQAEDLYETFKVGGKDVVRASGFALLGDAVIGAYEKVNILEKQNRKLSESFGVNTHRAAQLSVTFDKLGLALGVNTDKLKIYAGELKKLFPGQAAYLQNAKGFSGEIGKQLDLMRNKMGLSADATEGFIRNQSLISETTLGTIDAQIAQITSADGVRGTYEGAFKDIKEAIGNLGAETAAVFGRKGIGNLSQAVLGAKKLGVELDKILSTGTGFLDVEQAIGNEIELQMLGAKDLNISAIQQARLSGDGLALTQELTKYLEANGEEMKRNPMLLQKSADALGFSNDELLKMYANLQQNGKLEEENKQTLTARTDDIQKVIDKQNEQLKLDEESRRVKAGIAAMTADELANLKMTAEQEEAYLNTIQSISDIQGDKLQQQYAATMMKDGGQVEQVMNLAAKMNESMTNAAGLADQVVTALNDSTTLKALMGAGGFLTTLQTFIESLKTGKTDVPGVTNTAKSVGDVFIPAGGASSVISGPKGSFSLDPDDDIIGMPNARNALANKGGGDTAAVIAALKGMSFHVTNVFDGDKIRSSLQIRQGQQLNNTGIV
jgi:hypothetical protein